MHYNLNSVDNETIRGPVSEELKGVSTVVAVLLGQVEVEGEETGGLGLDSVGFLEFSLVSQSI